MKRITMVGLVTLTTLTAMAVAIAPSAMAESTALCSTDENPCQAANQLGAVHEASVGKATLLSSVLNVECTVLFSGTIGTKLASPLVITGNFSYSSCNSGCVVTEESPPATIEVLKEGHETASVKGEGLVHVNCKGLIDCSYNGVGLKGTAKGPLLSAQVPDNGEVSLLEQKTTKETGGFLCPKEAKLDITIAPSSGSHVASAKSTALCDTDPGTGETEECLSGHLVTNVHEVSVGKATLLSSSINVECNALFQGGPRYKSGIPLVIDGKFTYSSCNSGCVVTEENGPTEINVLKEGHETAKVTGEGLVHVNCSGFIDCSYNGIGLVGTAKGPLLSAQVPDNGEVSLQGQKTTKETGGFLCPKEAKLDIVTSPLSATYIAGAEATVLCDPDPGTGKAEACPSGHLVTHVHEVSVEKARLLSESLNVECDALFLGNPRYESGEPLVITGNFTYSSCNSGCVVTEENGPTEINVLKEGHETAKVTGEGLVYVNCKGFIDCSYNGVGLVGAAKGPLLASQENGEVSLQDQTANKETGGFLCPKTAKLDITITPLIGGGARYITN